jgi:hypothetical protein
MYLLRVSSSILGYLPLCLGLSYLFQGRTGPIPERNYEGKGIAEELGLREAGPASLSFIVLFLSLRYRHRNSDLLNLESQTLKD